MAEGPWTGPAVVAVDAPSASEGPWTGPVVVTVQPAPSGAEGPWTGPAVVTVGGTPPPDQPFGDLDLSDDFSGHQLGVGVPTGYTCFALGTSSCANSTYTVKEEGDGLWTANRYLEWEKRDDHGGTDAGFTFLRWDVPQARANVGAVLSYRQDLVDAGPSLNQIAPIRLCMRLQSDGSNYLVQVRNGNIVEIYRQNGGDRTSLFSDTGLISFDENDFLHIRGECITVSGETQIRIRAWKNDEPEPVAWTAQVTDSSIDQVTEAGQIGVMRGHQGFIYIDFLGLYALTPSSLLPPTNFAVLSRTLHTITAGWTDTNDGSFKYRLSWQRTTDDPDLSPWTHAQDTGVGATEGFFDNLPSGTSLRLRVRSFDPANPLVESDPVIIVASTLTDANVLFQTTFAGTVTGQRPQNTAKRWELDIDYTVFEDPLLEGGKGLRAQPTTSANAERALSFDAVGSRLNAGVLTSAIVETASGTGPVVVLRGAGVQASEATGYMVRFMAASQTVRLSRFENGQETVFEETALAIANGDVFWVREEAEVGQIRATVWRAGEAEADGLSLSGTDANPLPAGWVGVGQRSGSGVSAFDTVEVYEIVELLPLDPVTIRNLDTTSWRFWLNQPPNVEALVEGFDDPIDPVLPEDMPINSALPNPGQPKFNDPAEDDDTVTINITTPDAPPPGFTLTGYWITGIGEGEHSQVVGVNDVNVLLRENNGTGEPYTPTQLNGQWFCVRAIYNGNEVSGNDDDDKTAACNGFQSPDPTGPPAAPTGFDVLVPTPFLHRVVATVGDADGMEIERSLSGAGGPFSHRADVVQGSLPYNESSDPQQTKHFRVRNFNIVEGEKVYSDGGNYVGPIGKTTPAKPPPGDGGPNEPDGFTKWAEHDCLTLPDGALSGGGFAFEDYRDSGGGGGNYSIITDPNAPNGAAIRIRFSQGRPIGTSPGRFFVTKTGNSSEAANRLRRWYLRFIWMVEANPIDGRFEAPENEQKLWYGVTGGTSVNKSGTLTMNHGGPHLNLTTSFALKWTTRNTTGSCVSQPHQITSDGAITVGPYHDLEMTGEWSSPNAADAEFNWWLNGQHVRQRFTQNNIAGTGDCNRQIPFHELAWTPVWGGKCTTCGGKPNTKQRTDYLRLAYFYVSGEPF